MEIEILKDRFNPPFGAGLTVYGNVLVIPQSMIDANRRIATTRADLDLPAIPMGSGDLVSEADLVIVTKGK